MGRHPEALNVQSEFEVAVRVSTWLHVPHLAHTRHERRRTLRGAGQARTRPVPGRDTRSRPRRSTATAALLVLLHAVAQAQEVSPLRLKAAFIWNFAKFTEWPAGAIRAGQPFTMCVVGNAVVADALQDAVRDRRLADRRVVVWQAKADEQPPPVCQVLFVSGLTPRQLSQILSGVRDRPVLSISDIDGSAELGVTVQFLYEGSQVAFKVQRESARRASLQISSLVLGLSR